MLWIKMHFFSVERIHFPSTPLFKPISTTYKQSSKCRRKKKKVTFLVKKRGGGGKSSFKYKLYFGTALPVALCSPERRCQVETLSRGFGGHYCTHPTFLAYCSFSQHLRHRRVGRLRKQRSQSFYFNRISQKYRH